MQYVVVENYKDTSAKTSTEMVVFGPATEEECKAHLASLVNYPGANAPIPGRSHIWMRPLT